MAKVDVINWDGKSVGQVELNPEVFETKVRKDVLQMVTKWQLACRRQGTHSVKTRSTVRGGGKKPFKQKGTGNARQGSTRSPLLEGGAVVHGPSPRDYSFKLTKKYKKLGLKSALSYLYSKGHLTVVDQMTSSEGKTKDVSAGLINLKAKKALLVDAKFDTAYGRAAKNIKKAVYCSTEGVNVYDLLKYDRLIITKDGLASLESKLTAES